uniref:Uncharacterized protein n=1 Tax=Arundo donax TaxID=35708 RepID=A0A0A9EWQ7_ARUDO
MNLQKEWEHVRANSKQRTQRAHLVHATARRRSARRSCGVVRLRLAGAAAQARRNMPQLRPFIFAPTLAKYVADDYGVAAMAVWRSH